MGDFYWVDLSHGGRRFWDNSPHRKRTISSSHLARLNTMHAQSTRRQFLASSAAIATAGFASATAQEKVTGPITISDVRVVLPRGRVPLSFVIDDSTCLANMGHFCTPQFATAWPNRAEYDKPWKDWPREIPDAFVRQFGQWCAQHNVKGKYSVVPNPACVGWLDRELPGWSRRELSASLKLVRELMVPNWDIHPEMITHTRVIDLKSGRPIKEINAGTMENSYPQEKKSVDELAAYLAYALRILKNCELPCEGITTPGGFGNKVKSELSLAVDQAVRDVYSDVDLPHYFKYVHGGDQSTEPKLEHLRGEHTNDVRLTVNVPAGTGDWFGGWQGDREVEADRYATADGESGRMIDLIKRGQPAVMLCHWPGMYCNGALTGFHALQRIVTTLSDVYGDHTMWMKLSEIGRYYTAKELTQINLGDDQIRLAAPFAAKDFTIQFKTKRVSTMLIDVEGKRTAVQRVQKRSQLKPVTMFIEGNVVTCCFDLPKGKSQIVLQ